MNQQTTNRDTGEAAATNAPANSATSTSTPDNQPTPLDAFEVLLITGMSTQAALMPLTAWKTWDGMWSTTCLPNCLSRLST